MASVPDLPPSTGTLKINVNKDVVKHLSVGLYRNFGLAIKEIISNAYDAGATELKIKLDPKNKRITIKDDGRGMDYTQLKEEYLTVGFAKPPSNSPDKLGRMRIGTFGVGFLAPLPYCNKMIVITKKRDSDESIKAEINARNFFKEGTWDIQNEQVPYSITKSDLPKSKGETIIILEDIKSQIIKELQKVRSTGKTKLDQLSSFEKFKWTLCQYAPLTFPKERKDLIDFFTDKEITPMKIFLDGEELFRNVPENTKILEKGIKNFGTASVKYVIMTPYEPVKPEEARGLQVRLRNVAIGFPMTFEVTKLGKVLGKLNYLCGEVHIVKGLDNALMVDRDRFSFTEEYAEMSQFFRDALTRHNSILEQDSQNEKRIYDALGSLSKDKKIVEALKEADIVHFEKERLRMQEDSIVKTKKAKIERTSEKLIKALSRSREKEYKIITKKGPAPTYKSPISIERDKKSIVIYEDHPALIETIEINEQTFNVDYAEWEINVPYAICKLDNRGKRVIFNTRHPLFDSKLSDTIVKKLSLGIVLILDDQKDREKLISKFNHLIEEIFLGKLNESDLSEER